MPRSARFVLSLTAVVAFALAAAVPAVPGAQEVAGREIEAEAVLHVAPWRAPAGGGRPALAPREPGTAVPVAPFEGRPVPEAELESMRAAAAARAPTGRALEPLPLVAAPAGEEIRVPGLQAPKVSRRFNGIAFADSGGFVPPDTQIAAGPEHLLQAVNTVIRLTDKKGKKALSQTGNEHFDLDEDDFLFDPKVVYDRRSGRFFLVFLQLSGSPNKSFLYLSVSRDSTPATLGADDWCNYRIKTKKGGSFADYPGLGMNDSWLAVSTNNFRFANESFKQAFFWVIDKATLVDNATACPEIKTFRLATKNDEEGQFVFNPQVAQHQTASGLAGDPLFAVSTQFTGFSDQYVLWRIVDKNARGGGAPAPRATFANLTGSGYGLPPVATQKGGQKGLDSGDIRVMQQLVFENGRLWVVHGSGCIFEDEGQTFSCVRVARIVPDDDGAAIDFEDLFGVVDHFLFWPGIGVDDDGDVVAVFQLSGAKRRLSISYNGMRAGGAAFGPFVELASEADGFDNVKDLAKGKCPTELPQSGGAARTGDYVGVSPDPDGSGIWIAGEFGAQSGGVCGWKTKVGRADY